MSYTIDFFFNSPKSLTELTEDINNCLGCSLAPIPDDPQVLFTRFLSMEFWFSEADYGNDRELDFENFSYQLGFKTWMGGANARPIQLPAIAMVVYGLHRQLSLTGILVFDVQILLARYEEREVEDCGLRLYDLVSDTPFVSFASHLNVLTRRLPEDWQKFST